MLSVADFICLREIYLLNWWWKKPSTGMFSDRYGQCTRGVPAFGKRLNQWITNESSTIHKKIKLDPAADSCLIQSWVSSKLHNQCFFSFAHVQTLLEKSYSLGTNVLKPAFTERRRWLRINNPTVLEQRHNPQTDSLQNNPAPSPSLATKRLLTFFFLINNTAVAEKGLNRKMCYLQTFFVTLVVHCREHKH